MKHILQVLSNHEAYDAIRVLEPLRKIKQSLWNRKISITFKKITDLSEQAFVGQSHAVFHGVCSTNLVNLLRTLPCPFSFATDDLQTDIPAWNPSSISPVGKRTLKWCMDHSSRLICTTQALADHFNQYETLVCPNLLDFPGYEPSSSDKVVGLFGNSHAGDIDKLDQIKHAKVVIMSNCLPLNYTHVYRDKHGLLQQKPSVPNFGLIPIERDYEKYKNTARNLRPAVGLVPLVDCPFNRCKSILKFLEYTQLSAVTVCSDVPPYSGIPDECVVKVTDDSDWDEAIFFALNHPEVGERAYEWCNANYSYENNSNQWINSYEDLSAI